MVNEDILESLVSQVFAGCSRVPEAYQTAGYEVSSIGLRTIAHLGIHTAHPCHCEPSASVNGAINCRLLLKKPEIDHFVSPSR